MGDLVSGRPRELQATYSRHYCTACRHYFPADLSDLAPPRGHYTHRVMTLAVRLFYQVLDHDPAQADIIAFFQAFRAHLDARSLTVQAITTDGSTWI